MTVMPDVPRAGKKNRFSMYILVLLFVMVIAGGVVSGFKARSKEDRRKRTELMTTTSMLAQMLNMDRVERLTGTAADLSSPDYQRLKNQLMQARQSNPGCRFLYLVGQRGDDLFFYMDSEPPISKDYSPPGQVYTEAPPIMRHAFGGSQSVSLPYEDRWGAWITAMTPVGGPATGNVLALFCMDVDARSWAAEVDMAALPVVLTSLLFATILLVPILLLWRSDRTMQRIAASEEALEASERRNRAIVAAVPDLLFRMGGDTRILDVQVNPSAGFSLSREGLLDRRLADVFPPDVAALAVRHLAAALAGQDVQTYEYALPVDGDMRHFETRMIVSGRNEVLAMVRDMTNQKQAEQTIAEQRLKMANSARLSALGVMAGGIAHEINNPLSIIAVGIENLQTLLQQPSPDKQKIDRFCESITHNVERASRIIHSLRSLSRDNASDPFTHVPVGEIVHGTLELCRDRFLRNNVALSVTPLPDECTIQCRPAQIAQILLNLLNNAYDAVENWPEKWVRVEIRDAGDAVQIAVVDSGGGLSDLAKENLFVPFFTTKEAGKGTGLGLSLSKRLAEDNAGEIILDTASPHTCFVLRLPKTQNPHAASSMEDSCVQT